MDGTVEVRRWSPSRIEVECRGDFDLLRVSAIRAGLSEAMGASAGEVILDLSAVDELDVAAGTAVAHAALAARRGGMRFSLMPPSSDARRYLAKCGLIELLSR